MDRYQCMVYKKTEIKHVCSACFFEPDSIPLRFFSYTGIDRHLVVISIHQNLTRFSTV